VSQVLKSLSTEILSRMGDPSIPNIYVLGCFASRLTFSAQQTRAFNLLWALFEEKRLQEGHHVIVVGGGLAGMTASAAALRRKCRVTLIEKASHLLHLQRGNYTRYVHPNILRWPYEGAETYEARFPMLSWTANTLDRVVDEMDQAWLEVGRDVRLCLEHEVHSLTSCVCDSRTSNIDASSRRLYWTKTCTRPKSS
jgi:cation diffusion facilitator CzcD-associated flavoprotein CzcO